MEYAAIILLIIMSAFFSATETAFSSVNKIRLKHEASNGNKKATRALKIAENFDKTLTTILVGNNIVNILSTSLGTVICTELFGAKGVGIATAAMTVLILIFGEIMPKSLAKENAEKFIDFMCHPDVALKNFEYITYGTPNTAARELIEDEDLKNSPIAFPDLTQYNNLETFLYLGEDGEELYNKYWKEVMSN